MAADRIEIGYVAAAHGIRGELRVTTHDPASTTLDDASAVWIKGRRYAIEQARATPKGWLLALEDLVDRNAAEALRGSAIEVDREEIPMEEGDVLLADLVGCRAQLPDGTPWGEIVGVDTGLQVRLVIHDKAKGVERLVPLVDELVPAIDLDARLVTIDPPAEWPEDPL
jgi:16S rRNA processing protein RimM